MFSSEHVIVHLGVTLLHLPKIVNYQISGFLLLGARCRSAVDVDCVKKILEKNLKHKINVEQLFASNSLYLPLGFRSCAAVNNIVLTGAIRRVLVLVSQSWHFDEPVLLIGETGCGKTTVAQMLAKVALLFSKNYCGKYLSVELISLHFLMFPKSRLKTFELFILV